MSSISPNSPKNNDTVNSIQSTEDEYANLKCPITLEIMRKAMVMQCCGNSFDEHAIKSWLKKNKICPMCSKTGFLLTPNRNLQETIDKVIKANPLLAPKEIPEEANIHPSNDEYKEKLAKVSEELKSLQKIYDEASNKSVALEILIDGTDELRKKYSDAKINIGLDKFVQLYLEKKSSKNVQPAPLNIPIPSNNPFSLLGSAVTEMLKELNEIKTIYSNALDKNAAKETCAELMLELQSKYPERSEYLQKELNVLLNSPNAPLNNNQVLPKPISLQPPHEFNLHKQLVPQGNNPLHANLPQGFFQAQSSSRTTSISTSHSNNNNNSFTFSQKQEENHVFSTVTSSEESSNSATEQMPIKPQESKPLSAKDVMGVGVYYPIEQSYLEQIEARLKKGFEHAKSSDIKTFKDFFKLNKKQWDPSIKDLNDNGDSLLHTVVQNHRTAEFITFLLKMGLKVNDPNNQGNTPLHEAVLHDTPPFNIVKKLLKSDAKTFFKNNEEKTPLDLVAKSPYASQLMKVFEDANKKRTMDKDEGEKALQINKKKK